ncbi:hypothetical protein CP532_4292 [Ophiocordyceps camponoti-leonardi (nom. inval.)]|nr:hypothetical protein CP532_4292 [Ophiocordyceps camponoti-leonardi (nom. inval.)]
MASSRLSPDLSTSDDDQPPSYSNCYNDHEDEGKAQSVLFDAASSTRRGCVGAVSLAFLLALLCLIPGIYISSTQPRVALLLPLSTKAHEILSLAINVVLTFCIDGVMFVHSVSLRWALYREGRLEYNTNIRLFTSAKQRGPNKWYSNLAAVIFLVLSYGASSVLFLEDQVDDYKDASPAELASGSTARQAARTNYISGPSLIVLGLALAGQTAISAWCLLSDPKAIPSWSSNPLNNALAAIHHGSIQHRPGRCMLSVHQRKQPSGQDVFPTEKQGNILQTQRIVQYILVLLWALAALAFAWSIAILVIALNMGTVYAAEKWIHGGLGWIPPDWCGRSLSFSWKPTFINCVRNVVPMMMSPHNNTHSSGWAEFSPFGEALICIIFVSALQGGQTIGLHCAELLVNVSRDETSWRQASIATDRNGSGTRLTVHPLLAVLSSWEAIVLFLAKAVLHWTMGQAVLASISHGEGPPDGHEWRPIGIQLEMIYPRLFVYALLAMALAAFATYLALRRPRGYQPATMGHLQTIADLVDDWRTDDQGRMWWGDKTRCVGADDDDEDVPLRHAGTSRYKEMVDPIVPDGRYS